MLFFCFFILEVTDCYICCTYWSHRTTERQDEGFAWRWRLGGWKASGPWSRGLVIVGFLLLLFVLLLLFSILGSIGSGTSKATPPSFSHRVICVILSSPHFSTDYGWLISHLPTNSEASHYPLHKYCPYKSTVNRIQSRCLKCLFLVSIPHMILSTWGQEGPWL